MGNTPSSERLRKAPHKLSKPRPPSLAFDLAEDLSRESEGLSSPASTRYCHSYLAGSRRTTSYQHLPSPSHDGHSLYRQPSVASISPSAPCEPWRQPEPFDTVVWCQLHAPALGPSIPDVAGSDMRGRLIRTRSVVYPSGCAMQSLTRAYSFHSNAYSPCNPHVRDRRRYSTMDSVRSPDGYGGPLEMDFPLPHVDDTFGVFAQATDSNSPPSLQERAKSTSYVPMRRRSIYQTPGVATRAARDYPPLPTKPVIQISHLTPAVHTSGGSSIYSDDPASPISSNGPGLQERSVTPCDANYRQLGGIEFGTLRITNGSPIPSHAAHSDDWNEQLTPPPVNSSTQASFVIEESAWPLGDMVVANPDPGVEAGPKFHLGQTSPSHTSPNQNTPRKGHNSWLLDKDRKQVADTTPSPPTSPRPNEEITWSKGPSDAEFISPEALDVRTEIAANSQPNDNESPRPSSKSQHGSVGSDSGFVSSSTSSRQSSQRTLSKADSGYSSNFSLRSMRSNSSKSRRDAEKAKRASEPAPPKDQARQQFLAEDEDPYHLTNHQSMPLPRNAFALISRIN
ncbi:uncharacterized protein HRG_04477 [Hirsutella rhossiliensis]|uniref:Uncharacterized protein n=1 Tax=Hirsutella rhossiliensis TaxID=111463 RepID=A0A9P8N164_9HYPO|nr:uncharacterized protein HRG_04477 [Hirsutella rhossiliensis]KAH0964049.1 hypothetical protein HRG_04477 [Hirsutella rhossiliensis]